MALENLDLQVKEFGAFALSTLSCKKMVGEIYKELGINNEAEEHLRTVLHAFEKVNHANQIRQTKFQLAAVLRITGKLDEAADMYW